MEWPQLGIWEKKESWGRKNERSKRNRVAEWGGMGFLMPYLIGHKEPQDGGNCAGCDSNLFAIATVLEERPFSR